MVTVRQSPEYIKTSLAAAMTLGLKRGRFKDGVKLTGLNLLLTYPEGCLGRCAYCGISADETPGAKKTFIRVSWPVYELDLVIDRLASTEESFERICISMVTRQKALQDTLLITRKINEVSDLPISLLISPTVIKDRVFLQQAKDAGADMIGVAIDAATEGIFDRFRAIGVKGPHRWDRYWKVLQWSGEVFGGHKTGIHLICGLGETDKEMVDTIARANDIGAKTHLFSFYPEANTVLSGLEPPSLLRYRKIQIARYLINELGEEKEVIVFDEDGEIVSFDYDLEKLLSDGAAFMTSGCPCRDSDLAACNRPLANERPSEPLRNYPHLPTGSQISAIREQLKSLLKP